MTEEEIEKKAEEYSYKDEIQDAFIAGTKLMQEDINRLLDVINNQDVKIADLEKRNAQQCKTVERCVDTVHEVYEQYDKASEQLEQATKIIKKLLGLYFAPVVTNEDLKKQDEIIEQAEQFINLSEKATS